MLGIYQRGSVWWIRFSHAGKQHRVSLSTSDEAIAITEARRVLADPASALQLPTGWQLAASEFVATKKLKGATVRSVQNFEWQLEKARIALGADTVRDVTLKRLTSYRAMLADTVSPRSVREYWDYLNWFLQWCVKTGKLQTNPCASMQPPPKIKTIRRRFLSKEEIQRVMSTPCSLELRFILHCGIHAGLRKEEVIQARPEWFDLGAGLLHLQNYGAFEHNGKQHRGWQPKDKDARTIPLTVPFREFLKSFPFAGQDFCIAPGVTQGKASYRYDFRRPYYDHLTACGITDVTFHDLRRTFASQLVSAGVSLYKVAKWMGDGIAVAETHYGHLIPNDDEINKAFT